MKVISEFKNDLLKRRELVVSEKYESNPGLERVGKDIIKHFKVGADSVVVKRLGSSFGASDFLIELFIYDSVDAKNKIEPKKKEKKKK